MTTTLVAVNQQIDQPSCSVQYERAGVAGLGEGPASYANEHMLSDVGFLPGELAVGLDVAKNATGEHRRAPNENHLVLVVVLGERKREHGVGQCCSAPYDGEGRIRQDRDLLAANEVVSNTIIVRAFTKVAV